ncbi:hypothetical protein [Kitasatospora sp. NPDC050543]|uniref:hypothetical protein n=1 Tax=Kitasatospora sp. NPDC050543 TaxID=3364054 RepID=UPI0037B15FDF
MTGGATSGAPTPDPLPRRPRPHPRPAERWPRIAFELGRDRLAEAWWLSDLAYGSGVPLAELKPDELLAAAERAVRDGAELVALLEALDHALPDPRPQTLAEVLAPVRAYLLWALDADVTFEGASVFAGEIGRAGRAPVRVRVELQAGEPDLGRF